MSLSKQSIEVLIDLVEIRIDALQVYDGDDMRELAYLEKSRHELRSMLFARDNPYKSASVIPLFPATAPNY